MEEKTDQIFIDANFLIAIYNPEDALHKKASVIVRNLRKLNISLNISNYIFSEVTTVLSQKVGRKEAIIAGTNILKSENFSLIFIDATIHDLGWQVFQEINKKNMSFVDCSTLAVMRYMGIKKLLTFDMADFAGLRRKYSFSFFN